MRIVLLLSTLLAIAACSKPVTVFKDGEFPDALSAWGLITSDGTALSLHPDSQAYDLNTPLFTDYAHKLRTAWVPAGKQATIVEGEVELPVGSVITKTFYYPVSDGELQKTAQQASDFTSNGLDLSRVRLIETRLLVHLEDGWVGLPYIWNEAQTDASLEISGDLFTLRLDGDEFPYAVPDFNQCQGCHVDNMQTGAMSPIGLKVRHINKPYEFVGANKDQIRHLAERGMLALDADVSAMDRNADYRDGSADLDHRARSYLDINCGHCHNPDGPADTSGLFLNIEETNAIQLGVCKPPIAAGQGTGGHKVNILPGNAAESILSYRMESTDLGAMMPELGRSLAHEEGVALITEWINQMPGGC